MQPGEDELSLRITKVNQMRQEQYAGLIRDRNNILEKIANVHSIFDSARLRDRQNRLLTTHLEAIDAAIHEYEQESCRIKKRGDAYTLAYHQSRECRSMECVQSRRCLPGENTNWGVSEMVDANTTDILNEYMFECEGIVTDVTFEDAPKCPECNIQYTSEPSRGLLICEMCGLSLVDMDCPTHAPTLRDEVKPVNFSYKRINHFNDWLAQIQAKEKVSVSDDVIHSVHKDIGLDTTTPTHEEIRLSLKRLKMRKIYEHTAQVRAKITGVLPPQMTPEFEERCRLMFIAIQGPFERHRPPSRKNFLSYSFVLAKILELLGCDAYQDTLSLLKGKDKLDKQLLIWK